MYSRFAAHPRQQGHVRESSENGADQHGSEQTGQDEAQPPDLG